MDESYRVVFNGEIAPGIQAEDLRKQLSTILTEDSTIIDKLVSGETVLIKEDENLETCQQLQKAFLAIGIFCDIESSSEDPAEQTEESEYLTVTSGSDKHAFQQQPENQPPKISIKEKLGNLRKSFTEKFASTLYKAKFAWSEGTESLKSDMEIGGMMMVVKNKFFLVLTSASLCMVILLVVVVSSDNKVMPLTDKNLTTLLKHIEFIEQAFTLEELENMTKNPNDFLDYLLVDPIKKMGYEFEPTIEFLAKDYLNGDLSEKHLKMVKAYLEITAHERSKLQSLGFISNSTRRNLDAINLKLQQ